MSSYGRMPGIALGSHAMIAAVEELMLQDASFELIAAKVFELDDVIVEKE
jgi:hypothetical protein